MPSEPKVKLSAIAKIIGVNKEQLKHGILAAVLDIIERELKELDKPKPFQLDLNLRKIKSKPPELQVEETVQVLEGTEPADKSGAPRGPYGPRPKKPYPEWNIGSKGAIVDWLRHNLQEHPEGFPIVFMEEHLKTKWENVNTTCEKLVRNDSSLELVKASGWKFMPERRTKSKLKGIRRKIEAVK